MWLANSIKFQGLNGLLQEQLNDSVKKARIIYFEDIVDEVMDLKADQWCARVPFPETLISLGNRICLLVQERFNEKFPGLDEDDGLLYCWAFVGRNNQFRLVPLEMSIAVAKDGTVRGSWGDIKANLRFRRFDGLPSGEADKKSGYAFLSACIGHLTFLNCRNVSLKKIEQASEKVNRKRMRHNKKPLCSYYIANIESGKGQSNVNYTPGEGHNRFHMCRGHFKQKKLGRYWWRPHARGRKTLGTIVKDYKVEKSVMCEEAS